MKPLVTLAILAPLLLSSCGGVERYTAAGTEKTAPPITPELQAAPPTEEQLAKWEEQSFQPLLDRWMSGEDLDGHFLDLDWGEGREWMSPNQTRARVALLDVNGDHQKELALQTGCATVGNCVFHLYQRYGESSRKILVADMVQTFDLRTTKSNGFHDIETSSHGSATSGGIAIYKYDGEMYKITECFGYEYQLTGKLDRNGQSIVSEKPTLTRANCSAWQLDD